MKDILLASNFDVQFSGGDFITGESTRQHQQILLVVEKGELKEFPTQGVGTQSWLNDDTAGDYNAEVKREFERDGMTVLIIKGVLPNIEVEAIYE